MSRVRNLAASIGDFMRLYFSRSLIVLAFTSSLLWARPSLTYAIGGTLFPQDDSAAGASLTLFHAEQPAQNHCPKDTVVWLNLPSGIYHFKGQRWYGNSNNGAYVCEQEADQLGDRATLNGQ